MTYMFVVPTRECLVVCHRVALHALVAMVAEVVMVVAVVTVAYAVVIMVFAVLVVSIAVMRSGDDWLLHIT